LAAWRRQRVATYAKPELLYSGAANSFAVHPGKPHLLRKTGVRLRPKRGRDARSVCSGNIVVEPLHRATGGETVAAKAKRVVPSSGQNQHAGAEGKG
jgi:hypothetical protein